MTSTLIGNRQKNQGFPWESVGKRNDIISSCVNEVVATYVLVNLPHTELVVSRNLYVGMGGFSEAIVFDKVDVRYGVIKELHCLRSTNQHL